MPSFDGTNLIITLDAATTSFDVGGDIYSEWKEWFKTGSNSRYPLAFAQSVGGNPTSPTESLDGYYFLRNDLGWRIRPAEEDANIELVGNLFGQDTTLPIVISTVGNFTVLIQIKLTSRAIVNTAADDVTTIVDKVGDIHKIHGLEVASPLTVSATQRASGAINQTIQQADGTVTVTRTA